MPSSIGFHPADRMLSTDNPAPIRNNVTTSKDFEIEVIPDVIEIGIGK